MGVIFNPVARGEKAKSFRSQLEQLKSACALKPTSGPGNASELAMELVNEGYEIIVAAGGDGTIHEVINGIGHCSDGFNRVALGVIPFGTANVFACEHGIPSRFSESWKIVNNNKTRRIDLPCMVNQDKEVYFVQMAGAGFDALAVKAVRWNLKKKIGYLAYGWSAFLTALRKKPQLTIAEKPNWGNQEWIIISNGRFYAGKYPFFPQAKTDDGLFDICAFHKVNVFLLALSYLSLFFLGRLPSRFIKRFQSKQLSLTGTNSVPLELDGEDIKNTPSTLNFRLLPKQLTILIP